MDSTGAPRTLSGTDEAETEIPLKPRPLPDAGHKGAGAPPSPRTRPHDRDAFSLRLQQHFHRHAVNGTPFLLLALRGDAEAARSLDFPLLYEAARRLLDEHDDWFVDLPGKRLVVLLARSREADAHRFFARLKQRLLRETPQQAQAYLHAVTAIVVPNGGRFQNAEDFLSVALDEA